jgi:GH15 family glucan-1,4-alpha-glucosidase
MPQITVPRLDHAAVGNGRVLALVSPTSAIDWLCLPRMDSPTVFARLLDEEKGGTFRLLGAQGELRGQLDYIPRTNVVRTRFSDPSGEWDVFDFAPRLALTEDEVYAPAELVRYVVPVSGNPTVVVDFDPRPDYARVAPTFRHDALGVRVSNGPRPLRLQSNVPATTILERIPYRLEQPAYFVVTMADEPVYRDVDSVRRQLDRTIRGWQVWSKACALPAFAPEAVLRSALCLKLHISEHSGAVIAAATTSLPEEMHTPRTWDYRYCWLRDAAFVVDALRRLSYLRESERFIEFLSRILGTGPLQPVYGIDGERALPEEFLEHLAGFGGNGHVRIGNAAAEQRQNDLMGELVLSLGAALDDPRLSVANHEATFALVASLVEEAIQLAPQPDTGIWEYRTQLRHHTFSRAMCWAAMHRGATLARRFGRPDLAERWRRAAERERLVVLDRGYSAPRGYFTQALDGEHADASLLLLPILGLLPATDPRMISTTAAYEKLLVRNGMMLRYAHADDLGAPASAFSICTFWWAELLALQGRIEDAENVFERMMSHANPLSLFSEDIDPASGTLLGNFPQAYTHVGLIHAATTIGQMREARDGRTRGWDY